MTVIDINDHKPPPPPPPGPYHERANDLICSASLTGE